MRIADRLARLEAMIPSNKLRGRMVLPWEPIPQPAPGEVVGFYHLVAPSENGPVRVEVERSGVPPMKRDVSNA